MMTTLSMGTQNLPAPSSRVHLGLDRLVILGRQERRDVREQGVLLGDVTAVQGLEADRLLHHRRGLARVERGAQPRLALLVLAVLGDDAVELLAERGISRAQAREQRLFLVGEVAGGGAI